jgi:aminobenzoyl-glutamate utilization protein B
MTALDYLTTPALVEQAWDYFRNTQTRNQKYEPLIASTDVPDTSLNARTMERYRPEMRKYYYDPTKYKTYLDQLGIKYPTVRAAEGK